jgi:three-Cys-motif partner protein
MVTFSTVGLQDKQMATGDLVQGLDGGPVLKVGIWAVGKLYYIKRYCEIFNAAMKDKWPMRIYVDLFAGSGKCLIETTGKEIDGSALTAIRCRVPFTHYFFNDVEVSAIECLKRRASALQTGESIEYFVKDCNAVVEDLLSRLPANSLGFCFIDPLSWQVKFDSVRRLTQNRRMDIAVTFHVGGMKRVIDNPPHELLNFFPDSSWLEEHRRTETRSKGTGQILLNAYKQGLEAIGYVDIRDFILMRNSKHVPLYYLIFASKHHRGGEFWAKVGQRSETGQLRFSF